MFLPSSAFPLDLDRGFGLNLEINQWVSAVVPVVVPVVVSGCGVGCGVSWCTGSVPLVSLVLPCFWPQEMHCFRPQEMHCFRHQKSVHFPTPKSVHFLSWAQLGSVRHSRATVRHSEATVRSEEISEKCQFSVLEKPQKSVNFRVFSWKTSKMAFS